MDLESLKKTVANLTLYDLKAGVRQVQNAVMNYTEMEAKVREATNNDAWYVLDCRKLSQFWVRNRKHCLVNPTFASISLTPCTRHSKD